MEDQNESRDPRESLRPFITEARIAAFIRTYAPSDLQTADSSLTMTELRKFFDAYVKTCGDPLSMYVDDYLCSVHHFQLYTDPITLEPVMPIKFRQ